jgi:hypothetical protein
MSDLESALAAQRRAAADFRTAALEVSDSAWNAPRAPGKWSPAQVTDHVGIATKVARDAMAEKVPTGSLPRFLRPLMRKFFFDKIIRNGAFPRKGKGPPVFAPAHEPLPREQLCARIDSEANAFESDVRAMAKAGKTEFTHGFFGRIAIADYTMFNALHFDHHREQLPAGS